jgi:hypothetical protein
MRTEASPNSRHGVTRWRSSAHCGGSPQSITPPGGWRCSLLQMWSHSALPKTLRHDQYDVRACVCVRACVDSSYRAVAATYRWSESARACLPTSELPTIIARNLTQSTGSRHRQGLAWERRTEAAVAGGCTYSAMTRRCVVASTIGRRAHTPRTEGARTALPRALHRVRTTRMMHTCITHVSHRWCLMIQIRGSSTRTGLERVGRLRAKGLLRLAPAHGKGQRSPERPPEAVVRCHPPKRLRGARPRQPVNTTST